MYLPSIEGPCRVYTSPLHLQLKAMRQHLNAERILRNERCELSCQSYGFVHSQLRYVGVVLVRLLLPPLMAAACMVLSMMMVTMGCLIC